MPRPWERYQAQAAGPWSAYQEPEQAPEISRGRALGIGAAQGATFGFADEIGAAADAAAKRWLSTDRDSRSFGEIYGEGVGERRERIAAAREQHGGTVLAGELAGGLLTGVAGAGRAAAGATLRQALPRLAGTGAGFGAVAGAGYGEGAEGKATGAGVGAVGGAALGAALPVVGAGIRRGVSNLTRRIGGQGAEAAADDAARREILKELHRAGLSTRDAQKVLQDNPHLTLADLSENMQQLTANVARQPGRGAQQLQDFLEQRNIGQYDRVMPEIQGALGGASRNFAAVETQIMERARQAARPLYDEAYETAVRVTPKMGELMNRPSVKAAWKGAIRDAQDEGLSPQMLGATGRQGSVISPAAATPLNMARLDYTLRHLQRQQQNTRISAPGDSRRYGNLANELRDEIVEQNPVFGRARKVWAGAKADQDALQAGTKIFSSDADALGRSLRNMADSERDNYVIGALRAIERRMSRKTDTADVMRELRDTRHGRELMRVVMGDEAGFKKFLRMAADEKRMTETYRKSMTGSPTFERMAKAGERGEQLGTLAGVWAGSHLGIPGLPFLVRKAGRRGAEALERSDVMRRDALADMLMQRDPSQLLQALQRPPIPAGMPSSTLGLLGARQYGQGAGE